MVNMVMVKLGVMVVGSCVDDIGDTGCGGHTVVVMMVMMMVMTLMVFL